MKNNKKRNGSYVVLVFLLVMPIYIWTHKWDIYDYIRLRNYQAPQSVVKIATETTMNDESRKLFYVYYPELNEKEEFNANCKTSEKTIVLGCYVSGEGIYLFNVTDERLSGIVQVTAAHEILHAAYERLGTDEKNSINKLITDEYSKIQNQRIKETIDEYKNNGADIANELHSIMGTEIKNLSPALEKYYSKYFTNRLKIVEFSEKYEQAFTDRKNKVEDADKQLEVLKSQLDAKQSELDKSAQDIKAERSRLDSLLANKQYEQYNASVEGFNADINAYNYKVKQVGSLIDQYNALVEQRNAIASEEEDLVKAIDSRPDTIKQE